jgi:G:T-mismatch repair DNA endonuclease (very short patch repair protein)
LIVNYGTVRTGKRISKTINQIRIIWYKKIKRNIQRDKEVNDFLSRSGWNVLRFWGRDINKNLRTCTDKIIEIIHEAKRENKHL